MKRSRSEDDVDRRITGDFLIEAIERKLEQFQGMKNIEIETRLCTLTTKSHQRPMKGGVERYGSQIDSAAIVMNPHAVTIEVERADFDAIKAHLMSMEYLQHSHEVTETITFKDNKRLTNDAEGNPISLIEKKKLTKVDIAVPHYPYDIRIGVAQETALDISLAQAQNETDGKIRRLKKRDTFINKSLGITYDLTEVKTDGNPTPKFEFEIEKMFDIFKVSLEWISDMVYSTKEAMDVIKAARKAKRAVPVLPVVDRTSVNNITEQ